MRSVRTSLVCLAVLLIATLSPSALSPSAALAGSGTHHRHEHGASLLVSGLAGGSGSTIGPDRALYVAEPLAGAITRVDPRTGDTSTFATGLPARLAGFTAGGVMDVAFARHMAYALVTLVGPDVGGRDLVGLYRMDGPDTFTVVADIGAWSVDHPPTTSFFVPTGVQYALQAWHGGFLVTDGHHNRVLWVSRHGAIRELIAFGNVVPTGLDVRHHRVYLAEAGPVPHDPADGKVVAFTPGSTTANEVASGASILTDVEFSGHGRALYAISNGTYSGDPEGSPGLPDTGSLVNVDRHGGLDVVTAGLDRPTSLEFIHGKAYVTTWDGEIWVVPVCRTSRH